MFVSAIFFPRPTNLTGLPVNGGSYQGGHADVKYVFGSANKSRSITLRSVVVLFVWQARRVSLGNGNQSYWKVLCILSFSVSVTVADSVQQGRNAHRACHLVNRPSLLSQRRSPTSPPFAGGISIRT